MTVVWLVILNKLLENYHFTFLERSSIQFTNHNIVHIIIIFSFECIMLFYTIFKSSMCIYTRTFKTLEYQLNKKIICLKTL